MKRAFGTLLLKSLVVVALSGWILAPVAEAGPRGGGAHGGGGHGGGAHGGGGGANRGGGGGHHAQANNNHADARTNNVRNASVNNVNHNTNVNRNTNINRNTNVNVNVDNHHGGCCGWDNDYHPVATAAAIGATVAVTSAVVGSMVRTVPTGCVPVNYGGMVYQQCGSTWYQPQSGQYVVINPPY
jgi:hypothetical protein